MQHALPIQRIRHIASVALALVVALVGLPSAASAQDAPKEWTLKYNPASGTFPRTYNAFSLFNQTEGQEVRYGSRENGINLVWSPGETREWRLQRFGGWDTGTIRYGEPLALRNDANGKWVKYGHRESGINLVWSDTPVYEWQIRARDPGTTVNRTFNLALYNGVERDYVVYGNRKCGINLVWYADDSNVWLWDGWSC